jgi:hypothetical protein
VSTSGNVSAAVPTQPLALVGAVVNDVHVATGYVVVGSTGSTGGQALVNLSLLSSNFSATTGVSVLSCTLSLKRIV